jgi:hypothetical protein
MNPNRGRASETEGNRKMKTPLSTRQKYSVLLLAVLGGLLTVVNLASAQGWIKTSAPAYSWKTLASSADGTKLVAAGYSKNFVGYRNPVPIYTSADAGMTWLQTSAPSNPWTSVGSSADGNKLVAVVYGGPIYTSPDSGATRMQANAPSNSWSSVASSADGTKLVAVGERNNEHISAEYGGQIYTSSDSGATWAQTTALLVVRCLVGGWD